MRRLTILLSLFFLFAEPILATDSFDQLGAWSGVTISETEDPHASGFQIELWEHGEDLVGVMMLYVGPVADPPLGELEEVEYDRKSGELRFKAKMSIGAIRGEEPGSWIPSHDLYTFDGWIEKNALTGDLIQRVMNTDPPATNHQRIELRRLDAEEETTVQADSYETWRAWLDAALEARGSKW